MARSCMLLGATGLVGGHLLSRLASDGAYERIVAVSRRPLEVPTGVVVAIGDLGEAATYIDVAAVDDVYCCLGTTIKKAGSKEAFRRVDYEYPLAAARAALEAGATQYIIVTAVGADPSSSVFYNRVKGELEVALQGLAFSNGVKIVRPSILLGEREDTRPVEQVAAALMRLSAPAFAGPLRRYRAIDASSVADAMVCAALQEPPGPAIYEGNALFELSAS